MEFTTGSEASQAMTSVMPKYIRREEMLMTDYEIIMIFIGIIGLLISFGVMLIALLTFLDKRDKKRK